MEGTSSVPEIKIGHVTLQETEGRHCGAIAKPYSTMQVPFHLLEVAEGGETNSKASLLLHSNAESG